MVCLYINIYKYMMLVRRPPRFKDAGFWVQGSGRLHPLILRDCNRDPDTNALNPKPYINPIGILTLTPLSGKGFLTPKP